MMAYCRGGEKKKKKERNALINAFCSLESTGFHNNNGKVYNSITPHSCSYPAIGCKNELELIFLFVPLPLEYHEVTYEALLHYSCFPSEKELFVKIVLVVHK